MNLKEIKEMINLMNENNLIELEIEKEGLRIRLKKESRLKEEKELVSYVPSAMAVSKEISPPQVAPTSKIMEIKAPMVGTFYRAPSPEAKPFVEEGQEIEVGQVVCIIEAMKLMNEIKSEVKGKIVKILVENAEPVEFGQPLLLVEVV